MVQNDETQYIARILDGDTECFSAFLDRYSRPLYVLIVQIVGCSEDAEELVQDVFLKAFRCLGSYRGECRFSTWLYRIAYTTAVSATRKKKQEFLYIEENTSNFNYRMMEQIRLEAEKQQKRKERVMLCGMIAGILLLLGVGVYTLVFKLEFNFKEYLSGMDFSHADSSLLAFYSYIATLVLLLLGLDYWLRKKKFHS